MNNKTSRASPSPPFIHYLYRSLSVCSLGCLFSLSGLLAALIARSRDSMASLSDANLKLCFPDMDENKRKQLQMASLKHTVCAFLELAWVWYKPVNQVLGRIQSSHGENYFQASNKGRIVIAPHHGSWEMLNLWLARQGPHLSLYKPALKTGIDQFILSRRSKNGAQLVPVTTGGLRTLLKGLRSGASCMILPDQRPAEKTASIDAPFFGIPAPTSLLIGNICRKTDCEVFIAAITRDLKDRRYHLKMQKLDHRRFAGGDQESATYLNQSIESFISPELEQYQWPYRRFHWETYLQLQ